jgi:hypothetical protein
MINVISTFSLKPGYDPEETYKLWTEEHIPYVKKMLSPELQGYVIGRVVHNLTGGEFYGGVRLSFRSLEDAKMAFGRLLTHPDEFTARICNIRRIIVEERDVM